MSKNIKPGKLYVFEGPDGVGKTTLAQRFVEHLRSRNKSCDYLSFPGRESGTLGKHVYDLHHERERFSIGQVTATSVQALHIAAHLDTIERRILPTLRQGHDIALDRYWWSTWVYGVVYGANQRVLKAMIMAEVEQWEGMMPTVVLLISRDAPFRDGNSLGEWRKLRDVYNELVAEEQLRYPVEFVANDSSIDLVMNRLVSITGSYTGS